MHVQLCMADVCARVVEATLFERGAVLDASTKVTECDNHDVQSAAAWLALPAGHHDRAPNAAP